MLGFKPKIWFLRHLLDFCFLSLLLSLQITVEVFVCAEFITKGFW